jgi:glycosyltransferase involved in cell wall biosynthesis
MSGAEHRPVLLVVIGAYLPGHKAGGPIRSVANLVAHLGGEFQFRVLTADRDLGDTQPYPGREPGRWHPVGRAMVRYLTPPEQTLFAWRRLLRSLDYDLLYLNSYFARFSVWTLWLRRLGQLADRPAIVAPRGEFSPGALRLKAGKKRAYLRLANSVRLSRGVLWQVSSEHELADVRRTIRHFGATMVAPDLLESAAEPPPEPLHPQVHIAPPLMPPAACAPAPANPQRAKAPGRLRAVFLSRIARKKNLHTALELLAGLDGEIELDIYGPIEDEVYWRECQTRQDRLGPGARARYCGVVEPGQAIPTFGRYHLFLFPTLGENFGHVIAEALAAGCPVLVSDQTPWRGLEELGVGWDLPLDRAEAWRAAVRRCQAMDQDEWQAWSRRAADLMRQGGPDWHHQALEANRQLFWRALGRAPGQTAPGS